MSSTRPNIRLTSGGRTLADMTLGTLFQTGGWFPVERRSKEEPLDDWRWTLRSTAERPLLRFTNDSVDTEPESHAAATAERPVTKGVQRTEAEVVYGDSGLLQSGLRQGVSLEQEHNDGKGTRLHAVIGSSPGEKEAPSLALSAGFERQQALTHSAFRAVAGLVDEPQLSGAGKSGFQAVSLATGERIVLGDLVTIDAGTLVSAERLVASRVFSAPFLRVEVHPSPNVALSYRYAGSQALQSLDDLDSTEIQPAPLAQANGRPLGNPATHQQLSASRRWTRDVVTLSAYRDAFYEGIVAGTGDLRLNDFAGLPVTANLANGEFLWAVNGYIAEGAGASWTHTLVPHLQATIQADFGTTLERHISSSAVISTLQTSTATCNRPALMTKLEGAMPKTGTTFEVGYHWQSENTLATINPFDIPSGTAYAGVKLQQQIWSGKEIRRVHAVIEASNLLAEGYQPILGTDGKTLYLAQVPRSIQAGLVFSF